MARRAVRARGPIARSLGRAQAARRSRPLAELNGGVVERCLAQEDDAGASGLSRQPHDSERLLRGLTRRELVDEMSSA